MDFDKLTIFQRYCYNVIDQGIFMDLAGIYDHSYGEEKFKAFANNPIAFLTSRNEGELFLNIQGRIESEGYTG